MKKILFVLQSLRMGGAERLQVTIANKLARAGYDVTILIWKPLYVYRDDLDKRVHLIYKAPDEHLGNKIPYIRHKFYDDYMWQLRASPRQLYRYYVGHKKYDVEVAFFHSIALDIVAGSTNRKAKKIAWIHHDVEKRGIERDIQKTKELFYRIHNIVCVSNATRDSFLRVFGDTGNIKVIYNMLPIEEIRAKAEEPVKQTIRRSGLHIVMVGRFHAPKGYKRLIETVVTLHREGKDLSLSLIGKGDETTHLPETIRAYNAQDYIFVADGDNNPYPYIKAADLLVCSSFTEGYNLTVAEALVLGVPVLSTDCAGPREILDNGKYGMLVENSKEGLYNGLKALCESPALVEEYRKKAVERLDFFDEDAIFNQITALFEG